MCEKSSKLEVRKEEGIYIHFQISKRLNPTTLKVEQTIKHYNYETE